MELQKANLLKQDFEYLVGENYNNFSINYILVVPSDPQELTKFHQYFIDCLYNGIVPSIAPFSHLNDFSVYVFYGIDMNVQRILIEPFNSVAQKLNIEIDWTKY